MAQAPRLQRSARHGTPPFPFPHHHLRLHLDFHPVGPVPKSRRESVAPLHRSPGGIAARYALESVDWLWDAKPPPTSTAFRRLRLGFESDGSPLRFQVSGDQFFWLALDGHIIARGPDVSPPWHYAFSQYHVETGSGEHTLEAFVWWIGKHSPEARMTDERPGFALAGLGPWHPLISTGFAPWVISKVEGYSLEPDAPQADVLASGKNGLIDARASHAAEPVIWTQPVVSQRRLKSNPWGLVGTSRTLAPSNLPEMPLHPVSPGRIRAYLDDALGENPVPAAALNHPRLQEIAKILTDAASFYIPANSIRTLIWDLEDYYSGWPETTVSGGRDSIIRQIWSESLYETPNPNTKRKGNRDEVSGKYLVEGFGDRFFADGGSCRRFVPYWWRAGRYCLLEITTSEEPLILHHLGIIASGHPLQWVGSFNCDQDSRLVPIQKICRRTLEVGAWDSYQDSPYYEQLQYTADTRIEILVTYVQNANADLPLRALELLDQSRHQTGGLVAARFPSREPQMISPFSLIWILAVRDLMLWRNEPALLARLMPGVRHTIELFSQWRRPDSLLEAVPGWPYIDWVTPEHQEDDIWKYGVPAEARDGVSALVNLTYLLGLQAAIELETAVGETELAARLTRLTSATAESLRQRFWCPDMRALRDDDSGEHWSTQAQIYGILSGILTTEEGSHALDLAAREKWVPPSYMFRHYEFEALHILGRAGEIPERLDAWQEMIDKGSRTVWEGLEPTRSDCHGWSSHPLFHLPCSVAGIRPSSPGFATVEIAPQFGQLTRIAATVAHPRGLIEVGLSREGTKVSGTIKLPPGTTGNFRHDSHQQTLKAGNNTIG